MTSNPMTSGFRIYAAVLAVFLCGSARAATGASADGIWRDTTEASIAKVQKRLIVPLAYRTLALDRAALTRLLANAPQERDVVVARSPVRLALPMPDGSYNTFAVVDSPIMEPELAARHPDIKTWLAQSLDDPTATARIDLTPKGFHAQILGAGGTVYVDPYQPGDVDHYIAYDKRDHVHGDRGICLVTGEPVESEHADLIPQPNVASGGSLRTYRLAMAADGEYTQFQGGDKASALAAIVSTLNRVNGIYEREVAVRMVLVANEEAVIFTDPTTDPYANTSNDLAANQTTINSIIGSANYDIGHLVGTGGGGIAQLGAVCKTSSKAQGLTGSPAPIGDAYDVDYVVHEMGHQFGANHTFNGSSTPSGSNCGTGNRNNGTAYEPGSGITIMAYAGICGADNTQPHSEDYFHRASLNEILAYTTTGSGANCGTLTSTGNTPPTVTTAAGYTIPGRTPFTLTASGSDADGDPLNYLWEEFDKGTIAANAGVLVDTVATGPLFRSFDPTTDPTRTFPSLRYILNNTNLVPLPSPQTAPLEGTTSPSWFIGEALPNATRTLNFQVTVRDNRAGGGGTNMASTAIAIANAAGPFAITAPNTAVSWTAGSTQNVAWNVAGTTANGINAANVRITLSLDGGYTWPVELAASVPNNGSASIVVPASTPATTQARVRVEAVGNIFFDISDVDFTILAGDANTAPSIAVTGAGIAVTQGGPAATADVATVADAQDAAASLNVSVSGAPPELAVSAQNVNGTIQLTAQAECTLVTPSPTGVKVYPVLLTVTDSGGATASAWVDVNASTNVQPTIGSYVNPIVAAGNSTTATPSVPPSDANGNYVGISVSPTTLPGNGTVSIDDDGVVSIATTGDTTLGHYPIRVSASDTCGAVRTREIDLKVATSAPEINFVSSAVTTGNAIIEPNECNDATVQINNLGGGTATAVSATVSTSTPGVTIAQGSSAYPDLVPTAAGNNVTPFSISTDSTVACDSTIAITQSVLYAGASTPTVLNYSLRVGAPPGDYVFAASTGGSITAGGTRISGSQGDEIWVNVPVPSGFSFKVYDTVVNGGTNISATENGVLMIKPAGTAFDSYSNNTLPSALFGNTTPALFPYWDDMDMRTSSGAGTNGGIFTLLTGTAPNRVFQVEWRGVRYGYTDMLDFAVLLHENSDQFEFVYANSADTGASATIGAQAGYTQPLYTQYSYNTSGVVPAGSVLSAARLPAVCNVGPGVCAATSDIIFQDGFE